MGFLMNKKLLKYKDVYCIIDMLYREVKDILKDQFIGFYIHGSLALGDFDPKSSAIDFLVVTKERISQELFNVTSRSLSSSISGR